MPRVVYKKAPEVTRFGHDRDANESVPVLTESTSSQPENVILRARGLRHPSGRQVRAEHLVVRGGQLGRAEKAGVDRRGNPGERVQTTTTIIEKEAWNPRSRGRSSVCPGSPHSAYRRLALFTPLEIPRALYLTHTHVHTKSAATMNQSEDST